MRYSTLSLIAGILTFLGNLYIQNKFIHWLFNDNHASNYQFKIVISWILLESITLFFIMMMCSVVMGIVQKFIDHFKISQ